MRTLITLITALFFIACNNNPKEVQSEYPKQVGNRLYMTDSTFHIMDGKDTLTKLLHEKTLDIVE